MIFYVKSNVKNLYKSCSEPLEENLLDFDKKVLDFDKKVMGFEEKG
jgi:hypothetical protein